MKIELQVDMFDVQASLQKTQSAAACSLPSLTTADNTFKSELNGDLSTLWLFLNKD